MSEKKRPRFAIPRIAINGVLRLLGNLLETARRVGWLCVCYGYVVWWGISDDISRAITTSARWVISVGALILFYELAATIFGAQVHHLPGWASGIVLACAAGLALHHVHEWESSRKESVFAVTVATLFGEISGLDFSEGDEAHKDFIQREFIEKILGAFGAVITSKASPVMGVMLPEDRGGVDFLRVDTLVPADETIDSTFELEEGKGAAGTAYRDGITIYVPAIRYRHGISLGPSSTVGLCELVYEPTLKQPFKSLLCVPLHRSRAAAGILNVTSRRQNAFRSFDIQVALVAASAISMVLDRRDARR